ncbi:MAG: hypothetical protein H6739_07740 [Alphaproteobacteria bacterium]|nr:hypothetical protein [Alphaproteobacteria bacterium]
MSRPIRRRTLVDRCPAELPENAHRIWRTLVFAAPHTGEAFTVPWETLTTVTGCGRRTVRRHLRTLRRQGLLTLTPILWGSPACTIGGGQPLERLVGEGRELEPPPASAWRWTWSRSPDPELSAYWASASGPLRWRRPPVVVKRSIDGLWLGAVSGLVCAPLAGTWSATGRTRDVVAEAVSTPWRIPNQWEDNDV